MTGMSQRTSPIAKIGQGCYKTIPKRVEEDDTLKKAFSRKQAPANELNRKRKLSSCNRST